MHTLLDAPEKRELNSLERSRLAELAGLKPEAFCRLTIEEIRGRFGWQIDPRLLLFRRLSGKVLIRDEECGNLVPVDGALVHIESTLSDLLHFADAIEGGGCLLMTHVRRERILSVTSSADGGFSAWIPRFDIESLVRWRASHSHAAEALDDARMLRKAGQNRQPSGPKQAVHLERIDDVPDIGFRLATPGHPEQESHFEVQWSIGAIAPVELRIHNQTSDPRAFRHGIDGFSVHTGRARNLAADASADGRRRAG